MGKWKWTLIVLGVILIVIASFGFSSQLAQSPEIFTPENNPTFNMQVILAIGGLVAVIWGIAVE